MTNPLLVDSHAHLDVDAFAADRAAVIERARTAGVTTQIVPAIALDGFAAIRELCATTRGLFPAWGLHPLFLAAHRPVHLDGLREWVDRDRPVAIGECGLDFHVDGLDRDTQHRYLTAQLELAREADLPVILHARRAVDAIVDSLRRVGGRGRGAPLRGVVHSFGGSPEQAAHLWKLGFLLGIGGPVTYPRAARLRRLVATMPIEWLLLETDAPDQPLCGHGGERNEPERLGDVLAVVAALRDADPATVAAATTANAQRLFRLEAGGQWLPGG